MIHVPNFWSGIDGVVAGEFGFLAADGIYRTTIYKASPHGGYRVLGQTRELRRVPSKEHEQVDQGFGFQYRDITQSGKYWWDGEDGIRRIVSYSADKTGFHPVITSVPMHNPNVV